MPDFAIISQSLHQRLEFCTDSRALMAFCRWIMLWFCSFERNCSSLQLTSRSVAWGGWQGCWVRVKKQKNRSQCMKGGPRLGPDQYPYFTIYCWYWIFRCGVWPFCASTRSVWGTISVLCHTWKHRFWAEKLHYDLEHLNFSLCLPTAGSNSHFFLELSFASRWWNSIGAV